MPHFLLIPSFPFSPLPLLHALVSAGCKVSCANLPQAKLVTGNSEVKETEWEQEDLSQYDGVLIAPASRAYHLRGTHCFLAQTSRKTRRNTRDITWILPQEGEVIPCGKAGELPFPSAERMLETMLEL